MEENQEYLKYLFNEELYFFKEESTPVAPIPKEKSTTPTEQTEDEHAQTEGHSSAQETIDVELYPQNATMIRFKANPENSLPADQLTYLKKILGAVGLDVAQVDMIPGDLSIPYHKYSRVISFEIIAEYEEQMNYIVFEDNATQFLVVDSLDIVSQSPEKRKSLWEALQILFDIKK